MKNGWEKDGSQYVISLFSPDHVSNVSLDLYTRSSIIWMQTLASLIY